MQTITKIILIVASFFGGILVAEANEAEAVVEKECSGESWMQVIEQFHPNINQGHWLSFPLDAGLAGLLVTAGLQAWMAFDPLPLVRMGAENYRPEHFPLMMLGGMRLCEFAEFIISQGLMPREIVDELVDRLVY